MHNRFCDITHFSFIITYLGPWYNSFIKLDFQHLTRNANLNISQTDVKSIKKSLINDSELKIFTYEVVVFEGSQVIDVLSGTSHNSFRAIPDQIGQ